MYAYVDGETAVDMGVYFCYELFNHTARIVGDMFRRRPEQRDNAFRGDFALIRLRVLYYILQLVPTHPKLSASSV